MGTSEYMDLFLEESKEHLQSLNEQLLILENEHHNKDAINEIFRSAHTLKGMSATMGFENIAELTHNMENLLDKIRSDKLEVNEDITDVLFKCIDTLESMVENIASGEDEEFDIEALVSDLSNLENGGSTKAAAPVVEVPEVAEKVEAQSEDFSGEDNISDEKYLDYLDEYEKDVMDEALNQGVNVYFLDMRIEETCVMKAVRAFMVFSTVENFGEIIKSIPHTQDIEDENFEDEIKVFLVSKTPLDEIVEAVSNISEIDVIKAFACAASDEANPVADEAKLAEDKPTESTQAEAVDPASKSAEKETAKEKEKPKKSAKIVQQTVRVEIGKLDKLMNLVGELVINKTRLEQIIAMNDNASLGDTIEQVGRITTDLQDIVMYVRMVPIEQVFNRFPRMVRDISKDLNKEINLIIEGKETELDRTVIDEIGDPLVHLLRNSLDHGIEPKEVRLERGKDSKGTIVLTAKQEGNSVIITVEDDGGGINVEKVKSKAIERGIITEDEAETMEESAVVNLIFAPGFSTAEKITDVSGRGVGLDVVRQKIQSLRGTVHVESNAGVGSKFIIKLPLTLAIIQALMIKVGEEVYAIPLANIDETTSVSSEDIKNIQGQQVMVIRGNVLPLIQLGKLLEVEDFKYEQDEFFVVVVRKGEQRTGLIVSELIGQQEIVISSLGGILNGTSGIGGAAILGDGTVSLILDISTLF